MLDREVTGDPFNADPKWIEIDGRISPFNPMINGDVILTLSMLTEETAEERRGHFPEFVRDACSNLEIDVDEAVFQS
jgi:glutaminase